MKIIIDSGIPYIEGLLEPYGEVVYSLGGDISPEMVATADALIVRTRTRCDERLLRGSRVKHIATATIGFDHIDLEYCKKNGIKVTTSAGCNARAVLHWMGAVLATLSEEQGWSPAQRCIGVVGVGNVGSLVKEYCQAWGFEVICCDPPRAQREGITEFMTLEEVARRADILTIHTPLNDSTHHLIDSTILDAMPPGAILVNASRGEVVDGQALRRSKVESVLDVWEGEPNVDKELLSCTLLATYHVAGYSKQGKANATAIVVGDMAKTFSLPLEGWYPNVERITPREISWERLLVEIKGHMDIRFESELLKRRGDEFETLRNSYTYRDEIF